MRADATTNQMHRPARATAVAMDTAGHHPFQPRPVLVEKRQTFDEIAEGMATLSPLVTWQRTLTGDEIAEEMATLSPLVTWQRTLTEASRTTYRPILPLLRRPVYRRLGGGTIACRTSRSATRLAAGVISAEGHIRVPAGAGRISGHPIGLWFGHSRLVLCIHRK